MEEVKENNISILLPRKWLRADLKVAIPEILKDHPDLKKEHDLGLVEICLLAGTIEEKPDTFLLTRSSGEIDSSLIALELKKAINKSGGLVLRSKKLSESKFEIVAFFKQTKMVSQYIYYQENEDTYWEFYFTASSKSFLFKKGSFWKIHQSFRNTFPMKKMLLGGSVKTA